jgi:hypothetical protein
MSFESFIGEGFYCAVGFYHAEDSKKTEMFETMEKFAKVYGNVPTATMDIAGQNVPKEYGISEDVCPIVVVFKQGSPLKAVNVISVENIGSAIAPPGKNITLQ